METIRQFWRRLAPREQGLVGGGAVLLLIVVLVFYVWQPLEKERTRLRTALPKMRAEAQMMAASVSEVARLRQGSKQPVQSVGGLRELVVQSAGAQGIEADQAVLENGGKVRVTLSGVSFDNWVKWLGVLQAQHGIRLESCRVEALPQAGMVKVQASLAKG